jgi:hypothetical protein
MTDLKGQEKDIPRNAAATPEISPERLRDFGNWRRAAEKLQYEYYKRELGIALYDWAPSLLAMAEEALQLRRENEQLRHRLERVKGEE